MLFFMICEPLGCAICSACSDDVVQASACLRNSRRAASACVPANRGIVVYGLAAGKVHGFFLATSGGASGTPSFSDAAPSSAHSAEAIQNRTTILFSAQPRN